MAHAVVWEGEEKLARMLSRRGFMALAGTTAFSVMMFGGGCSSSAESEGSSDSVDSGALAGSTGDGPRFDPATFTVADAFGATYDEALAKVQELAPDAVLMALRASTTVQPGGSVSWDYLFGSATELRYYIVFTGSVVSAAELGDCTMKFAEWANVPPVDSVKVDAASAWNDACQAASSMPAPGGLYVYLILYSEEADTASSAYSYDDAPLTWYFEFIKPSESADGEAQDAAATAAAPEDDLLAVYAVSAETGEVACVLEANQA